MKIKASATILFFLLTPLILSAQVSDKWTKIISLKDNFAVLLPSDFLVDTEKDIHRIYAYRNQVSIRIEIQESEKAKAEIKAYITKNPSFLKGDFIGNFYADEKNEKFSMKIWLTSSKVFYTVFITANDDKNLTLINFLNSIKLDNEPFFKQTSNVENKEVGVSLDSLKTSPAVLEALAKKDTEKTKIKYDLDGKEELDADLARYSRPLLMIRKSSPKYTDSARQNNTQGEVKLNVVFRADGQIGDIIVLNGLSNGLTEQAVMAARKIKFLPAEIDGKYVDVIKTVRYQFTIY